MPGVAYVAVDGIPDPVRVRFAWHSDDTTIAQLTAPVVEGPRPDRGRGRSRMNAGRSLAWHLLALVASRVLAYGRLSA